MKRIVFAFLILVLSLLAAYRSKSRIGNPSTFSHFIPKTRVWEKSGTINPALISCCTVYFFVVESCAPTKGESHDKNHVEIRFPAMTEEADFLQIKSIDHVHFYVGNAKHAMFYWWKAYGFKPVHIQDWKPATATSPRMF